MGNPTNVGETLEYMSELGENLIRTGTIQDGSCLIHSLLTAINPTHKRKTKKHPEGINISYRNSTLSERKRMAIRERRRIATELTSKVWESCGEIARIEFQKVLRKMMEDLYDCIENNITSDIIDNEKFSDCSILLKEVFTRKIFTERIFPEAFKICENKSLKKCSRKIAELTCETLIKELTELGNEKDKLEERRLQHFVSKMSELIYNFSVGAERIAFTKFKGKLANPHYWAGQKIISLLSQIYGYDLYFIDNSTKLPYRIPQVLDYSKRRDSIIILWVNQDHYEGIGRKGNPRKKLENPNKTVYSAQRIFPPNDPLVIKIRTLVCDFEKAKKKYPELAKKMLGKRNL
jgi:hypothetical protein